MAFESLSDFFYMGGHGFYVWLAYAIAAGVVAFNLLSPRILKKQLIKEHQRKVRREKS